MPEFFVGEKVIDVDDNRVGIIIEVLPLRRGRQYYIVRFGEEEMQCPEGSLNRYIDIQDPFELLKHGIYGGASEYVRLNTAAKIKNVNNNTVSTLMASKTEFKAYQYKPLLKFLNSSDRRILVADEVGLGKTIEAGHIMLELKARRELRNAIIVCPKSLKEKWQVEMQTKFGMYFKIYDGQKRELLNDLRNDWSNFFGIINYESLRSHTGANENDLNSLLYVLNAHFDFVICDEAHRIRNNTSQIHIGTKQLVKRCRAAVFLTATPIMIDQSNLFNLLNILNEERFSDYSRFYNALQENAPFVRMLNKLSLQADLTKLVEELASSKIRMEYVIGQNFYRTTTTIQERYKDIPLYQKIIELSREQVSPEIIVKLQETLSSMSVMNDLFSRTRKVDVTQDMSQPTRDPQTIYVQLYQHERNLYDEIINQYVEDNGTFYGANLGLVQTKRQVASSVYAYLNDDDDLDNENDCFESYKDAKFDKLCEILQQVIAVNHKKIIVFSIFVKTLKYLKIRLDKMGFGNVLISGSVHDRVEQIERFKNDNEIPILLSSEVGSEGLDMQFCDSIVNYDLPWNPMVVEQRIGRIDRFGQCSPIVHIYNFIVSDSIQEIIYERLLDRINIFRECIGDLEAILSEEIIFEDGRTDSIAHCISSLEDELYRTELTRAEIDRRAEAIAVAIENEKNNLHSIDNKLTNTLTNDVYLRNEIEGIQRNYRYVTNWEVENFIHNLIRRYLSTCEWSKHGDLVTIAIPPSNQKLLINFLTEFSPTQNEVDIYRETQRFINLIRDTRNLEITFERDYAINHKNVIYIDAYHPLVLSALRYFEENGDSVKTFSIGLNQEHAGLLSKGLYILATYMLTVDKNIYNCHQEMNYSIPILYDVQKQCVVENQESVEHIYGQTQQHSYNKDLSISLEDIDDASSFLTDRYEEIVMEKKDYYSSKLESSKLLEINRISDDFNNKIKTQEGTIASIEQKRVTDPEEYKRIKNVLPAMRGTLKQLFTERDHAIESISKGTIVVRKHSIQTLSALTIS